MATTQVIWQGLKEGTSSLETMTLTPWVKAMGTVIRVTGEQGQVLDYTIHIGEAGYLTHAELFLPFQKSLSFRRDTEGCWFNQADKEYRELRGATDLDISATPFTNTLPLQRLQLKIGEQAEILVGWVGIPGLDIRAVPQRYTRLAQHLYRYENLSSGYTNDITVDEQFLVVTYPHAFQRIALLSPQ